MNKKTLSIFLALVVSVCAGLSACADPPGIAQPYSGQPIAPAVSSAVETTVSSESVSSTTEETTISSAVSEESAVTSEIEKTTPQESYTACHASSRTYLLQSPSDKIHAPRAERREWRRQSFRGTEDNAPRASGGGQRNM